MNAYVVVDLGFGDSGKGLVTDFLVRQTGAGVVIRYNGGAQAGHNVITPEGVHHTFAQFGAGSFVPGVRTFLSRHVVVHPTALRVEARVLAEKGLPDALGRIRISERARIITPFHQSAGRIRELARGTARHGSCGVGVGETVKDAFECPEDTVLAGDLQSVAALRRKLRRTRERKHDELRELVAQASGNPRLEREVAVFQRDAIIDDWIPAASALATLGLVVPDSTLAAWVAELDAVVFEGAQGVLLDEWCGFHPFTSWSLCTAANAMELLDECAPDARVERIGVLRSHMIRHGPGPLPTETDVFRKTVFDHNRQNEWQGPVRYGWFDAVLARYALDVVGGLDALALTHLDAVPQMPIWQACVGYRLHPRPGDAELIAKPATDGLVTRLLAPAARSIARQARLAGMLARATPVFAECEPPKENGSRRPEQVFAVPARDPQDAAGTAKTCSGLRELIAKPVTDGLVTQLLAPEEHSIARQARLTGMLARATPVFEECEPHEGDVLGFVERLLGRSVNIVSRGPCANDVSFAAAPRPPADVPP